MNVVERNLIRKLTPPCITLVEGEVDLALAISHNLKAENYVVQIVDRGDKALHLLSETPPDLVILDWMLRGISGPEICVQLRARDATRRLPIIMLSERGEELVRLRGFSAGTDDFVVKPFSMPELMARVRALLRRSRADFAGQLLTRGDLHLDRETRRVRRGLRNVHLRPKEFGLLECMLERPGGIFSRRQLLDRVWGRSVHIDDRAVDVYVGRLRKALSTGPERDPILSVRGTGYAFDETFGKS